MNPQILLAKITEKSLWMPSAATESNQVDAPLYFILWVTGFFLVLNSGLMIFFAIRYRQKKKEGAAHGHTHNTALEITWSVLPAFILAIMFIWGFQNYMVMATPPTNAMDINVTGKKWVWDFQYPDGRTAKPFNDDRMAALHVPAGTPIRLNLRSVDVIHSVFIPAMRVKKDVVPGRVNQLWFTAMFDESKAETVTFTRPNGDVVEGKAVIYDLFCTEYCGQDHSMMITKLYVYQPEDFERWQVSNSIYDRGLPLIDLGKQIYNSACVSCHSLDGSAGAGPTWTDLYGATGHATNVGPVDVDFAYIAESIRNPGAKLAEGYGNVMAPYGYTDREIAGVIEFMKQYSQFAEANTDLTYGDLNPDGTLREGDEAEAEGESDQAESGESAEPTTD